jgi:hypothetical protein
MRVVVNHLTRMRQGFICVAGIDVATTRHVRPESFGQLPATLLARNGGPFDIAASVELGPTTYIGIPPQVEDYRFDPIDTHQQTFLTADEFWRMLQQVTQGQLMDIFGMQLKMHARACAVDVGTGSASLGCLAPKGRPVLRIETFDKPTIKIEFTDGTLMPKLSVTDLRLFEHDQQTPRKALVDDINARIRAGVAIVLSVGLGRKWKKPGDTEERHWLQVNNIHLEDNPLRRAE